MKKRDSFTNRLGFILACVGSAVGMGNLWMFPTRVSLYDGGSFLIPYFIFVVLIGLFSNTPPPKSNLLHSMHTTYQNYDTNKKLQSKKEKTLIFKVFSFV